MTTPRLYFVSIHEGNLNGPTIYAGHFEARDAAAARALAIRDFSRHTETPANALPIEQKFMQLTNEQRDRAIKNGYVAVARKSNADPAANAVNRVWPTRYAE